MANNFRNINYGRLLLETLRSYYAVNAAGSMSVMYKFLLAIVQPLQGPFDQYALYRLKESIIANCKWQIGQLTNVLNLLYDPILNRIFISQSEISIVDDPTFAYEAYNFDTVFAEEPAEIFEKTFADKASTTLVEINVPTGSPISDITATVEQIKLTGIPYQIIEF
jgi:hypothetical protein